MLNVLKLIHVENMMLGKLGKILEEVEGVDLKVSEIIEIDQNSHTLLKNQKLHLNNQNLETLHHHYTKKKIMK